MAHFEGKFGGGGVAHGRQVLTDYLPGLDPGVTPLSARSALVPASTLKSLRLSYGRSGADAVLAQAGITSLREVPDAQALHLLRKRNIAALPPREHAAVPDQEWHLRATNVKAAWDTWGGPQAIDWAGVRVGQVDTGYTRHPALGFAQNTWVQVNDGQTFFAPGNGPGGAGPGGGLDPLEVLFDGHGTRVASVICGDDPAAPGGAYLGVAPRVPLVPVRIANTVLIAHAQRELAMALRYLVRDAQVSVINLSMGFLPRTQIRDLDKAIDEAYEAGVIFVCAAGQPLSFVVSPAHGRHTIAVAGSTQQGIPWGESARGPAVDWTAPAKGLFRADAKHDGSLVYAGDGDGTSYAAAISTGAAALWLAHHGSAIAAAYPQPWQRVEAFKAVARATALPMPNQQPGSFGTGILDVGALVNAPLPPAASLQPESPA